MHATRPPLHNSVRPQCEQPRFAMSHGKLMTLLARRVSVAEENLMRSYHRLGQIHPTDFRSNLQVQMPNCDFRLCDIRYVDMSNTNCAGGCFEGMDLRHSAFDNVILRGANLRNADLRGVALHENAEFEFHATFFQNMAQASHGTSLTDFSHADLKGAKLNMVLHRCPPGAKYNPNSSTSKTWEFKTINGCACESIRGFHSVQNAPWKEPGFEWTVKVWE